MDGVALPSDFALNGIDDPDEENGATCGDEEGPKVESGDAPFAEKVHNEAPEEGANDAVHEVHDEPHTGFGDKFGDPTGNEADNDPSDNTHGVTRLVKREWRERACLCRARHGRQAGEYTRSAPGGFCPRFSRLRKKRGSCPHFLLPIDSMVCFV